MTLKLEIRRNSDGKIVTKIWPNWDYNQFWWEEGNASCDCNRELFFTDNSQNDPVCSEGRYSVRLSNNETGELLYDEFKLNPV